MPLVGEEEQGEQGGLWQGVWGVECRAVIC